MTVRPILFSGPMVCALLEGRKTQTRRVINPQPTIIPHSLTTGEALGGSYIGADGVGHDIRFFVGDLLYVREAWQTWADFDHLKPSKMEPTADILFIADRPTLRWDSKFRQGMHMPRWASRLTLKVTDVMVQRLQDISEEGAKAEGAYPISVFMKADGLYRGWFHALWDNLNEKRGFGWDVNPWVVAVTFEVHHCNVDAFKDEVVA